MDDMNDMNDICKEINHQNKLDYYCNNHNMLCCAACIAKIEGKGNGQHSNCNICYIENIKEEKNNILEANIKYLEEMSTYFNNSISEIKKKFQLLNNDKNDLKAKITHIFKKLRNLLRERESQLLKEVDEKFNNLFSDLDMLKEIEELPSKIQSNIIKGNSIKNEWKDNNKLISMITDCIDIENNVKDIKLIHNNIQRYDLNNMSIIEFSPKEKELENFIYIIKEFGKILEIPKENKYKSGIIKYSEEIDIICDWINRKVNEVRLIYKATIDGDSINDFQKKCTNKGPTVLIIKSGKNQIFGFFTEKNWVFNRSVGSPDSFLFNISSNKSYKINNGYIHLYSNNFGYGKKSSYILEITNKFLSNNNRYQKDPYSPKGFGLINEDENFSIQELEVFKIIYD